MTPKTEASFQYLLALTTKWGGFIEVVNKDRYKEIDESTGYRNRLAGIRTDWSVSTSYGHALNWKDKIIVVQEDIFNVGTLIHEMGHAFLDLEGPQNSEEMDWLGWEICLARAAKCYRIWSDQNNDYTVELPGNDRQWAWSSLSSRQRKLLVEDRVSYAKSSGIIDARNNPLPKR